jgi:DNA-binding NarL/FixJ family response regulator
MEKIRVIIADDQAIFRDGLQLALSREKTISVVGQAENGAELLRAVDNLQPDVVLTDLVMPVMGGIEATRHITDRFPQVGVIALSIFGEEDMVMDMLDAGALGYLVKNADKAEIYCAVEAAYNKQPYYCKTTHHQLTRMISRNREREKVERIHLNDKERQIIIGICDELSNQEMARELFMSKRTVDGYRARILEKLGVRSAIGVVKYAIKEGIYRL